MLCQNTLDERLGVNSTISIKETPTQIQTVQHAKDDSLHWNWQRSKHMHEHEGVVHDLLAGAHYWGVGEGL